MTQDIGGLWRKARLRSITWQTVGAAFDILRNQIETSGFRPDAIAGICRGGLPLLTYLSNVWATGHVACMRITRNLQTAAYSERAPPRLDWIVPNAAFERKSVLLVDDIAGDGGTLTLARQVLFERGAREVRSAVLVKNRHCRVEPEYYVFSVDDWVVFPWEPLPALEAGVVVAELALTDSASSRIQAEP